MKNYVLALLVLATSESTVICMEGGVPEKQAPLVAVAPAVAEVVTEQVTAAAAAVTTAAAEVAVVAEQGPGVVTRSKDLVVSAGGFVFKYRLESAAAVAVLIALHNILANYSPWYNKNIAPYVAFRGVRKKLMRKLRGKKAGGTGDPNPHPSLQGE